MPYYGLDADLKAKYDEAMADPGNQDAAREAEWWIQEITDEKVAGNLAGALKTGEVLCTLINKIKPGTIKVNKPGRPFKERENISNFLKACRDLGVHEYSVFGTDDLYEEKNMLSVVRCLHALGGAVQKNVPEWTGPCIGIKDTTTVSQDRKRNVGIASQTDGFSKTMEESQIDTSKNIIRGGGYRGDSPPEAVNSRARVGSQDGDVPVYGLDAELKAKMDAKYDIDDEEDAIEWIQSVTGFKLGEKSVGQWLHTGKVLCAIINKIKPDTIKVNNAGMAFKERENISKFLQACRDFGVHENSCFGTDDLYDEKNMGSVITCIHALGGAVQANMPGYTGPVLGVADTSGVKQDARRHKPMATQNGGYQGAMDKLGIDVSNSIVKNTGGAISVDKGATKLGAGCGETMERSQIDKSNNIVKAPH